jgi:hypothetical protein
MNAKVKKIKEQLERAGGVIMIPDDLPDDIAEIFVKGIMSCPQCAAAIAASTKLPFGKRGH